MKDLPVVRDERLIASWNRGEDAAVWRIDEKRAGVLTVDFITPVVDSPFDFGRIAAVNSLSDVYAMGGKPLVALNVVCFPTSCEPIETLKEILRGGAAKVTEAGAMLAGGHSVQDDEPKYGLVVFGEVEIGRMWPVAKARPNDALILTKPIGTGIAVTAIKAGLFPRRDTEAAVRSMSALNAVPCALSDETRGLVHACTDVTGFGLAGHALDLTYDGVSVEIDISALPVLPGVKEMADMGLIPAGTYTNRDYLGRRVENGTKIGRFADDLAFDPQTSGGLLIAIPEEHADDMLNELRGAGFCDASRIGRFTEGNGTLKLV